MAAKKKRATQANATQRKLKTYHAKRDFGVTKEPSGKRAHKTQGYGFVVQKHAARALHYDFRLELDGVLLSWSVPKGPSLVPGERRLSVRTEDHPLAYADFEGVIPQGEYGGGTVLVWDRGSWAPHGDPKAGLKKGHLEFELSGEKLHGRFHLVRTQKPDEKRENWLLFKGKDEAAVTTSKQSIVDARPESVITGRSIEEVAAAEDKVWHSNRAEKPKKRAVKKRVAPTEKTALDEDVVALVKKLPVQFPLTNLSKVLYPEQGLRKAELIAYAAAVSPWMLPHVAGRPLTLVRCPDGRTKHCFYQKHAKDGVPDVVGRVAISEEKGKQDYMRVDDAMGLVALVQLGALELHTWVCHADKVEKPDQLVFDLDPHESIGWDDVVEAAFDVRKALASLELESFVKTTGGKGLHVVVPLQRRHGWQEHKDFAEGLSSTLARHDPKRFLVNPRKDLRKGRIFVDYLRNGRGATAVAPYSTRARENATVATPLTWEELEAGVQPLDFTVKTVISRMRQRKEDPWAPYFKVKQSLGAAQLKAVRGRR